MSLRDDILQALRREIEQLRKCLASERKQHQAELERLRSRGSTCCDQCSFWSTSEGKCSLGDPREDSQCGEFLEHEHA